MGKQDLQSAPKKSLVFPTRQEPPNCVETTFLLIVAGARQDHKDIDNNPHISIQCRFNRGHIDTDSERRTSWADIVAKTTIVGEVFVVGLS